jgi:predicted dehydrogenase
MVAERCRLAEKAGAVLAAAPDADGLGAIEATLDRLTGGRGADQVFLVASGSSNEPVEVAAKLARDRATVVDIGKTKLDLPWNAYYDKELDVRFSRSYGPGRYDPTYEVEGVDYPVGYVRWTERRNLACFIDLIASGSIDPEPLVSGIYPFEDAANVYEKMGSGDLKGVGFLFRYDEEKAHAGTSPAPAEEGTKAAGKAPRVLVTPVRKGPLAAGAPVKVGFIGAGNYASSMLLPHMAERPDVQLARVATRKSLSAINAQRKFSFAEAGTDLDAVLEDTSIDAVFVVTRHSSHASLTCRALEAGKAVFVEKPLALSHEELDQILATVDATGNDRLMVGFNRRFSPMFTEMRRRFGKAPEPVLARYFVNAGPLASDSWYRNEDLEGSRFVGEGGHFIDTVSWWTGANPVEVSTMSAGEGNIQVSLRYSDGSLGTITYFANGHPRFPKETFEAVSGGKVARLENFRKAAVWSGRKPWRTRTFSSPDKGQKSQVDAFFEAVRQGSAMPIPLASLVATTKATLAAEQSLTSRGTERV